MKSNKIIGLIVAVLLLVPAYAADNVKDLQKQQKKLQEEIEQTNKMLKQTKRDESATMNKLQLIGQNIKNQRKFIMQKLFSQFQCRTRDAPTERAPRFAPAYAGAIQSRLRGNGAPNPLCPYATIALVVPAQ